MWQEAWWSTYYNMDNTWVKTHSKTMHELTTYLLPKAPCKRSTAAFGNHSQGCYIPINKKKSSIKYSGESRHHSDAAWLWWQIHGSYDSWNPFTRYRCIGCKMLVWLLQRHCAPNWQWGTMGLQFMILLELLSYWSIAACHAITGTGVTARFADKGRPTFWKE